MFGILAFVLWVLSSHQKVEHGVAVYLLFKPAILVVECREAWIGKRWRPEATAVAEEN